MEENITMVYVIQILNMHLGGIFLERPPPLPPGKKYVSLFTGSVVLAYCSRLFFAHSSC